MSRAILPLVLALTLAQSPAVAQCFLCDDTVEMNDAYAACFRETFSDILEALDASELGFHAVDFKACEERTEMASVNSITGMGELPPPPKAVYVLDRERVQCLHRLVGAHDGPFDPRTVFLLSQACADGG